MKTELKAKYLQHLLSKKKNNEGFTLIELLVVIIIIGILAAIALPSFLNQANKARQSEAKTYVGSMNRGQQAFYLENATFAGTISALEIGISDTKNYKYAIATSATEGVSNATMQNDSLRGYAGRAWKGNTTAGDATVFAILCEGNVNAVPAVTGKSVCP
jgi:type IV pilus assembly protein PilA